jgi:hypothetical protein
VSAVPIVVYAALRRRHVPRAGYVLLSATLVALLASWVARHALDWPGTDDSWMVLETTLEGGGDEGTRTPDPRDANAVLSQLSYIPTGTLGAPSLTAPVAGLEV